MKRIEAASSDDLLALKVIVENLDRDAVAREGKITVGAVDGIIERAVAKDLRTKPPSRIRRIFAVVPETFLSQDHFLSTDVFTVQWHITQSCDLHCRHCYDRTARKDLRYEQADKILDDLRSFSHERNVTGAVSFSGGNPFLQPDFMDIYRAAAEKGFSTAILGNPVPRQLLEEVIDIRRPAFFQVSLEGDVVALWLEAQGWPEEDSWHSGARLSILGHGSPGSSAVTARWPRIVTCRSLDPSGPVRDRRGIDRPRSKAPTMAA